MLMRRVLTSAILTALVAFRAEGQSSATGSAEPSFNDRPLSAWVEDLKAPAPVTRNAAAYAIASMGPAAKAAVPALIVALEDEVAAVRYPAAVALKEIGPAAVEAIPALEKATDDRSDDVAHMARKALRAISGSRQSP